MCVVCPLTCQGATLGKYDYYNDIVKHCTLVVFYYYNFISDHYNLVVYEY